MSESIPLKSLIWLVKSADNSTWTERVTRTKRNFVGEQICRKADIGQRLASGGDEADKKWIGHLALWTIIIIIDE